MTEEIIQHQDHFYILATSSRLDEHLRLLKHGDTFSLCDRLGNIQRVGLGEQGLYHEGTRYLSRFDLRVYNRRPLLLSSAVREDNALLTVDLTNPDFSANGHVVLPRESLHLGRTVFLWNARRYERITWRNYLNQSVEVNFSFQYDADFTDIFEVRGTKRRRRGELLAPEFRPDGLNLSYRGLDGVVRVTSLVFTPLPSQVHAAHAEYKLVLEPHGEAFCEVVVTCDAAQGRREALTVPAASAAAAEELRRSRAGDAVVQSSNEQFNDWLNRSAADLHLMLRETPSGPYPFAGVPWFSTFFGRDGIITALEYLWINPALARGVLGHLASEQAVETDPVRDAEPGKILHESRLGEMAALGEIPFGKYYGSVDSTPLFIVLAGAYYQRTGDREFIESIWANVLAALEWIDRFGDCDGDGFVEYERHSDDGLSSQGWKDSADSVFHADGAPAEGPVALCEVQGYVFAAKRAASALAAELGDVERAGRLMKEAESLRDRFEAAYWCEDLSTYAIALDGRKRPCRVRTSNAGHCLLTGIAAPDRAARVAGTLLADDSFSGWGIRTVSSAESRYNPMSYHNGSVWPHDNALIAAGLSRYGLMTEALRVFTGLFDASLFVVFQRMPELVCGFDRRPGQGPVLYPVACSPQSWAAAAVFLLIQSLLGITLDAPNRKIRFAHPVLPPSLKALQIRGLSLNDATVDLNLTRQGDDVGVDLVSRTGDVQVVVLK